MDKDTTDKQIGARAAAKEIYRFSADRIMGIGDRTWSKDSIEAIILKHCPDDRGAGKLVEALNKISPSYTTVKAKEQNKHLCWHQQQYDKFQEIAEAALAEYEANK